MLVLTIVILSVLALISYALFDRDLLAPPTVVCLGLLFSALCAFYNEKTWGLEFSKNTMWFIASGVFSFLIGGILAVLLFNLPHMNRFGFSHELSEVHPIYVNYIKTVAVILLQLLTLYFLFRHIRRLTGYSNWMSAVARYRELVTEADANSDTSIGLPFLLKNLLECGFAIATVYSYIAGNNLVSQKKQQWINWIPIILCAISTFMRGDRSNMIRLWLTVLITAYTIRKRSVGWKNSKETKKMIKIMALSLIAVGALFVGLREIVGRKTSMDPLYYLTFYAGCPTAALDQFLKSPRTLSSIWGKETFYYLNVSLNVLFGKPERYPFYKEFIKSPNGTLIGNVYTALRPPYQDFGFWGMIRVMLIMGAFFTFLYCLVRKRQGRNPVDFRLLMYCYIAYTFFMYFYNCYNAFISHSILKLCIELLLVRWVLVSWSFKRTTVRIGGVVKNQ